MSDFFDVVIVGAGISGISAAWHLQKECPELSFVILERRDRLGGTWDLFKYPGIRSDSDMYTLGFHFKPWATEQKIADGQSIWNYLNEAATENGIDKHVRYGHKLLSANWLSEDGKWELIVDCDGKQNQIKAGFLWSCSGYYSYDNPYLPKFADADKFSGTIVHPQQWPEEFDYKGKKIVVIGSGATAISLIPALVDGGASRVTMLQRTPTFVAAMSDKDPFAAIAFRWLPEKTAYRLVRWKTITKMHFLYQTARIAPDVFRNELREWAQKHLPKGYDYDQHFSPNYKPWDQRVCLATNGDIFDAIRDGKANVVTDMIDRFTANGILLKSGEELSADIIVTATGFNLQYFGGAEIKLNGKPVNVADLVVYKSVMLSGVPNMALTFGYTNASWTLKADLTSGYVARLLRLMGEKGYKTVVPRNPGDDVKLQPIIDLSSSYVTRALDKLPKSGSKAPWLVCHDYLIDYKVISKDKIDDGTLEFYRDSGKSAKIGPMAYAHNKADEDKSSVEVAPPLVYRVWIRTCQLALKIYSLKYAISWKS